jgi:transcriptional regulator with XRE-family HTH domain
VGVVGERLRILRKRAGLTQVELGSRLGVTGATISGYETGDHHFIADELPRFAEALNVHPCDFFEERARSAVDPPYGQDIREQIAADVLDLARALSPARVAVVRRVLQGLDEAGVE